MKGIVWTGRAGGPRRRRRARPAASTRCGCASSTPGCATATCRSSTARSRSRRRSCSGHEGAGVVERGGRRRHQGEGRRPRGAHHARQLRALRRLRPGPAHPLPRHDGPAVSRPFTVGGEKAFSFANTGVFTEEVVVNETQAVVIDPEVPLERRLPHRLRGRHRRRGGAQPGQGPAGPDGGGHRRRRHRPVGHPGRPHRRRRAHRRDRRQPRQGGGGPPLRRHRLRRRQLGRRHGRGGQGPGPAQRRRPRLRVRGPHRPSSARASTCSTGAARSPCSACPSWAPRPASWSTTSTTTSRSSGAATGRPGRTTTSPCSCRFYKDGRLLLDEMVSQVYPLDQITQALDDLHHGKLNRGVLAVSGSSEEETVTMEFGVFAQLFVPAVRARPGPARRAQAHLPQRRDRQGGRPQRLQVRVVPAAPLPRRVQPHARARGVPRLLRRPDRAGAPGLGDLQHHAAGQQAAAHRRERRPARPPDRTTGSSSAPAGARRAPRCWASTSRAST